MNVYAALLLAILEAPEDDFPRLAMADLFEEQGQDERAELIRVQIELARSDFSRQQTWDNPRTSLLVAQQDTLLAPHNVWEWVPCPGRLGPCGSPYASHEGKGRCRLFHAPAIKGSPDEFVVFTRGFVSQVEVTCQKWLDVGTDVVRKAPIERVVLTDKEPARWGRSSLMDRPGNILWRWFCDGASWAEDLPKELFDCLLDGINKGYTVCNYQTKQAALDALSTACLKLANGG